jgi:hypothetical protein
MRQELLNSVIPVMSAARPLFPRKSCYVAFVPIVLQNDFEHVGAKY